MLQIVFIHSPQIFVKLCRVVRQITKERLQSVYVSLKDLECQIFETEIGAIRAARSHIDELARECYLAFTPRRNAGYF